MEAELAVMQPQPKERLEPPEAARGEDALSTVSLWRERGPTNTLILHSGFQNCERIHFCCFKPPNLWLVIYFYLFIYLCVQSQETNTTLKKQNSC